MHASRAHPADLFEMVCGRPADDARADMLLVLSDHLDQAGDDLGGSGRPGELLIDAISGRYGHDLAGWPDGWATLILSDALAEPALLDELTCDSR